MVIIKVVCRKKSKELQKKTYFRIFLWKYWKGMFCQNISLRSVSVKKLLVMKISFVLMKIHL